MVDVPVNVVFRRLYQTVTLLWCIVHPILFVHTAQALHQLEFCFEFVEIFFFKNMCDLTLYDSISDILAGLQSAILLGKVQKDRDSRTCAPVPDAIITA